MSKYCRDDNRSRQPFCMNRLRNIQNYPKHTNRSRIYRGHNTSIRNNRNTDYFFGKIGRTLNK